MTGGYVVCIKGLGLYRKPKTHIQHTQHLSTNPQATRNDKSTHRNMIGQTEGDNQGYI